MASMPPEAAAPPADSIPSRRHANGATGEAAAWQSFATRFPEVAEAIRSEHVSFSQLVQVYRGRVTDGADAKLFQAAWPRTLKAFEEHHGQLESWFPAIDLNCYVARTAPSHSSKAAESARAADFHILYDLAHLPVGGDLMTRIEMMASDATRILKKRKLTECLDQIYSKTTDVLGLALAVARDGQERVSRGDQQATPLAKAKGPAPTGRARALTVGSTIAEDLEMIRHDLGVIELKFLSTEAREVYFVGAVSSAMAIGVTVLISGIVGGATNTDVMKNLGTGLALAISLGAAGAMLSVIQRLADASLRVRYDLDRDHTSLLGALRPLIGAFGGGLVWVLIQSKVLSDPGGTDYYVGALAFAVGLTERSLGDVVTKSGILAKLTPATNPTSAASNTDQGAEG